MRAPNGCDPVEWDESPVEVGRQLADTPFFDTGLSWYVLMHEPSKGGHAYIKLARQYMVAWLNGVHGANLSVVADDLQLAMDLLDEFNSGLLERDSCEESD